VKARIFVLLALLLLVFAVADLFFGSAEVPPGEVLGLLLGGDGASLPPSFKTIVLELRLPKVLVAILAGAALAVAGLLLQTLFRNPLAGPDVLGINSGASLGVALVVLWLGGGEASFLSGIGLLGDVVVVGAASAGAGAALALILWASRRMGNLTLLVLGVILGYTVSALTTILLHMSLAERMQAFMFWTFGSFGGVGWSELRLLAPLLVLALAASLPLGKPLNALAAGESLARSLGVGVRRLRRGLLIASAVLAGGVTAFCGPISFLAIAVPHLCRLWLKTADHRILLPACALAGAAAALLADLLTQVPPGAEVLPLNAVTSLLGAPLIGYLLLRRPAEMAGGRAES
jgi:iron complex transport system permease protein